MHVHCQEKDLSEQEDKHCDMNVLKTVLRCSPSDAKVCLYFKVY